MRTEIRITKDGSNTLFVPSLNEHYHSYNGAFTEANHIFIEAGFNFLDKENISILELGFGTGLNAILTFDAACKQKRNVFYSGVELYPLDFDLVKMLNYSKLENVNSKTFELIHQVKWEEKKNISANFTLLKLQKNILDLKPNEKYDLVYFDAFAPEIQPKLWSEEVFLNIYNKMNDNAILLTYSAKGTVKRALRAAGFTVKRLPGPPGKRHILRATKSI